MKAKTQERLLMSVVTILCIMVIWIVFQVAKMSKRSEKVEYQGNTKEMVVILPSACERNRCTPIQTHPTKCFDCEAQESMGHWQVSHGSPKMFGGL